MEAQNDRQRNVNFFPTYQANGWAYLAFRHSLGTTNPIYYENITKFKKLGNRNTGAILAKGNRETWGMF
jgi:hypothetical protein